MNPGLLIVDDDANVTRSLTRALNDEGYPIYEVSSGREGLDLIQRHEVGVVLSDRMMPEMDGICFLEKVRELRPETVRILMTGHGSLESAMEAIERAQLFGYLLKPWSSHELKTAVARGFDHYWLVRKNRNLFEIALRQNRRLSELNENLEEMVRQRTVELEEAVSSGIFMLAKAAEAKDDQTGGHVQRIQFLVESLCTGLGLPARDAEAFGLAAITHDVGKIHVPDHILRKSGRLTQAEWDIMKTHTLAGEAILTGSRCFQTAGEIARSHHERWDGSGYPDRLAGSRIPFAARVVAVADVFDALASQRPYKPAWPLDLALAEIERLSGSALDPQIVGAFLKLEHAAKGPYRS